MALVETASSGSPAFAEVARAPLAPDAAWSHPEAGVRAQAFGVAEAREGASLREVLARLESPAGLPGDIPGPWLGAAAFSGTMGPAWSGFSPLRFVLPRLFAWSRGGRHFLAAFGEGAQRALDEARRRLDEKARRSDAPIHLYAGESAPRVLRRRDERRKWDALVTRALEEIGRGALEKVVVARAIDVEADAPLDPAALLRALEARYPSCRSFLVPGDGAVFLGATPEILCRVEGAAVEADALAGTARPGEGEALLGNQKDLREHRWVVEHVVRALGEIAGEVRCAPEPVLRTLANLVHLHTPIRARLAPGRGVADVAAALHPTPAVGGVPVDAALRFLSTHERLDRGLYAGLVGWVGDGRAELGVALRSALVRGNRARLFVGAGIVEGSSPEAEWEETELKARPLLDALGARP